MPLWEQQKGEKSVLNRVQGMEKNTEMRKEMNDGLNGN